jgi:hypothetical protein
MHSRAPSTSQNYHNLYYLSPTYFIPYSARSLLSTHSTSLLSRLPLAANHSASFSSALLSFFLRSIFALASLAFTPFSTAAPSSGERRAAHILRYSRNRLSASTDTRALSAIDDVAAAHGRMARSSTVCVMPSASTSASARDGALPGERRARTRRAKETRTSEGRAESADGEKRREKAGRGRNLACTA